MSQQDILTALDRIRDGGFRPGRDLEAAHHICQSHEGEAMFDWIHALVHRIEGDDGNAAYWYRRAGRTRSAHPVDGEWQDIRAAAGAG